MRIGLFGGTFNPVHLGHLLLTEGAREILSLNHVLWIPSRIPPHKSLGSGAGPEDRCRMVELAIEGHPNFHLSRLELERPGPSYTIDTVLQLQKEYSGAEHEWYFLLGSEAAEALPTWRESQRLFTLVKFAAVPRPGLPVGRLPEQVRLIPVPTIHLSASEIRERVGQVKSIRYLVPELVRKFIEEKGLYRRS